VIINKTIAIGVSRRECPLASLARVFLSRKKKKRCRDDLFREEVPGAPSARILTLTVVVSGRSATNTLPGHPGMSRDSAFSYGTSVVPGLTMLAGTSRLSYASLK
jgi:hypothetical protein